LREVQADHLESRALQEGQEAEEMTGAEFLIVGLLFLAFNLAITTAQFLRTQRMAKEYLKRRAE
jgi:hypothetical protein